MTYQDAVNLITGILNAQRLTISEHTRIQEAWKLILENGATGKKDNSNGDNELRLSGALQQSQ